MNVSDALQTVRRLYIDSAPLIYYVEENPNYVALMDAVIQLLDIGTVMAFSSVILLPEVLSYPLKLKREDLEKAYREVLTGSPNFELMPVNHAIAERATELRAHHNLRTPDALHLATALEVQCDAFLTNDLGLKRVTELSILVLDELTLDSN